MLCLAAQGCKENLLTPVTSHKTSDSLAALINRLNSRLVSVSAKDNALKIQLATFQSKADSLKAVSGNNNNYLQTVQYTVYLVDGSNTVTGGIGVVGDLCAGCKTTGINGATVMVFSNGKNYSAQSVDGRAIFANLQVAGLATVAVSAPGYTSCTYSTYFNPSSNAFSSASGGIRTVSVSSSSFSGYSGTFTGVAPSSTTGTGTGAQFAIEIGGNGQVSSLKITAAGRGYKNGDEITFNGFCDCGGSITYTVMTDAPTGNDATGAIINASTNVMLLPTKGVNLTTFTGQLFVNRSSLDDTLGRLYNNAQDAARYLKFISPNGPYHGNNYTGAYSNVYSQNQYSSRPAGNAMKFSPLTQLAGVNFIYGYPTNVSAYYAPYSLNYQYLPGDIISISYFDLTAFATIDATGQYTLSVPSYVNDPSTTIGTSGGLGMGGNANVINYQDNLTYLGKTLPLPPTAAFVTLNFFDPTSYAVTKINNTFYPVTQNFEFYPFIDNAYGYYDQVSVGSYSEQRNLPGQSVIRNIFFIPFYPSGD